MEKDEGKECKKKLEKFDNGRVNRSLWVSIYTP